MNAKNPSGQMVNVSMRFRSENRTCRYHGDSPDFGRSSDRRGDTKEIPVEWNDDSFVSHPSPRSPETPTSRLMLRVVSGPHTGESFVLPADEMLTVGRSHKAMVPMGDDICMSSFHFVVQYLDGVVHLSDQGSTNKTKVNNAVVYSVRLLEGDVILAGRTEFCLEQVRQATEMVRPQNDFIESSRNNFIEPSDVEPFDSWLRAADDIDIPRTLFNDISDEDIAQPSPVVEFDGSSIASQYDYVVPRKRPKASGADIFW